jgi:hypothetical protein
MIYRGIRQRNESILSEDCREVTASCVCVYLNRKLLLVVWYEYDL